MVNCELTGNDNCELIASMKARKVIEELGGPASVARRIKSPRRVGKPLTTAAVSKWERIPPEHCVAVSEMSDGKYPPHKLRPDFFPKPVKVAQ